MQYESMNREYLERLILVTILKMIFERNYLRYVKGHKVKKLIFLTLEVPDQTKKLVAGYIRPKYISLTLLFLKKIIELSLLTLKPWIYDT